MISLLLPSVRMRIVISGLTHKEFYNDEKSRSDIYEQMVLIGDDF